MLRLLESGRCVFHLRQNRALERFLSEIISRLRGIPTSIFFLHIPQTLPTRFDIGIRSLEREEFALAVPFPIDQRAIVKLARDLGPCGVLRGTGFHLVDPSQLKYLKYARPAFLVTSNTFVGKVQVGGAWAEHE